MGAGRGSGLVVLADIHATGKIMSAELLRPADRFAGEWIASELDPDLGSVTSVVPNCFEAYVRILHPAVRPDGTAASWSDVASQVGGRVHALVQWHLLVGSRDPEGLDGSRWKGGPPARGDLSIEVLRPLCVHLAANSKNPAECFFGLWTGLSWLTTEGRQQAEKGVLRREGAVHSVGEIEGPTIGLPPKSGREYVLLAGSLSAAIQIGETAEGVKLSPTSPNLMWPSDRSWFLASDIDFDSTLVGGSTGLVEAIINDEEIEAWPIGAHDSLAASGDHVNGLPK